MIRKFVTCFLPAIALLATCTSTYADCGKCGESEGACCGTKTVCQRQYVTEMKTVTCTEYKKETR